MADRGVGELFGIKRSTARLGDLVGQASSIIPIGDSSIGKFAIGLKSTEPDIKDGLGTLAGAGLGYWWGRGRRHPWLGLLGGASIGRNVPAMIMHPEDRKAGAINMASTGGGISGSLLYKKHPVWGFIGGYVGVSALLYLVGYRR